MTTLIFIRHAQSEGNLKGICSGQIDFPLVEKGFAQAQKTADYLRAIYPITAVYTSDLCRTAQTAQPTAEAFGLVPIADPRFREVCVGEWDGQPWSLLKETYPEIHATWTNYIMDRNTPRPKGAECREEVLERVSAAIGDVIKACQGGCVAIFCHSRMIRVLADYWRQFDKELDEEMTQRKIKGFHSCSVTVAEYDDDGTFLRAPLCCYRSFLQENSNVVAPE
ncbi:MAG: histidine phosphatase family protein [Clostridia bacterium]|nr:histidine phosphatase family protein [Clostridia bacterium]